MKFQYQARDDKGRNQKGVVEASSEEVALQILDRYGFYVTLLEPAGIISAYAKKFSFFDRVPIKDVMLFSRQLAIMFKARVSLVEALVTIGQQNQNKAFREKLLKISEEVEGGTAFSDALSKHPKVFSSFYVSMVKRGEALGKLSDVLSYLSEHLEREYALRSKVRGAMMYPGFVLVVAAAVLTLLSVMVLPNLTSILTESGQDLPLATRVVIAFSDFYKQWWWLSTLVMIGIGVGIFRFSKTSQGKKFFDTYLLKTPLIRTFLKMMYVSRFGENLSTLITGGVPIVKALDITGNIVGNDVYKKIIREARDEVAQGSRITDALEKYPDYFPPIFTQMVRVGEKSGALDTTMMEIVGFYQKEVDRSIDGFLSLIEPIMIVVLGVLIGGVMASVVLPLYQISSQF